MLAGFTELTRVTERITIAYIAIWNNMVQGN